MMNTEIFNEVILPKILKYCRMEMVDFLRNANIVPEVKLNMDFDTGKVLFNTDNGDPIIYKNLVYTNNINDDKILTLILDDYMKNDLELDSNSKLFTTELGKIKRLADERADQESM